MREFLVVAIAHLLFIGASTALADTVFYTEEADWLAALSGDVEYFATTAENIALADEVATPPADWEVLEPVLTFQSANTGLSHSFEVATRQPGSQFLYVHDTDHTDTPGLYVGQEGTYEDDDWEINVLNGPGITAFAFDLVGNNYYEPPEAEAFEIYDLHGMLLGRIDETTNPSIPTTTDNWSQFLGVVTTEPIGRVFFDEDNRTDDIVIANFRFVPEPSTALLLALSGLALLRRKRP